MGYRNLAECVADLEKHGHLLRIKEEVDPHLEMASIHMRVYDKQGPALLFEKVKGSPFPAVSNLFGTLERSRFMFRDTLEGVQKLVGLRSDPIKAIKNPIKNLHAGWLAASALPKKVHTPVDRLFNKTTIDQLPQILNWPMDGGPFVTMPQVYTEDIEKPGVMQSNLGMYRIQLQGNDYELNKEVGLHYQLHRGIGVHQAKANAIGQPLKVSVFVGGPPSHALAAVMPLPEGMSELTFAGVLGKRRFRYLYDEEGFCLSADADFVITGTVYPNENKPEGPFGDHLGYYSLIHDFPLMHVHNVYYKKDAIWSFTVVGRPPQEDTSFGALIHDITGSAIPAEINGLHAVHAVDAAGVHPLLFAIGSERYTPYLEVKRPQEILTIANQILGKNQLSLAKYLWIAAKQDNEELDIDDVAGFLKHMLCRMDFARDLHFQTKTTIDTLDYTGDGLNAGSKVVFAAAGNPIRNLIKQVPSYIPAAEGLGKVVHVMDGVLAVQAAPFTTYEAEVNRIQQWAEALSGMSERQEVALLVLCDDADFTAADINNFVWVTFTKSNPSHDIHGIESFTEFKHWGCKGPLIIDARKKGHHAPDLIKDPEVEAKVDALAAPGKPLFGVI